ncbi:hypothetical protein NVP1188A_61 [Vibrio phage 1.188.A._10N.286.51.A6]|uniref:PD-(D/E)XK nuclease superfamily protein n=3 Tax=Mukerjeevirus mv51A6 TaxID=2734162 RepID=A0A2I7RIZ9_9CAUD|nr:exonuclease [Vibrio phage 1.188.A._10N.286.51.A6]AUR93629.1 hypothetical protein NVP1188A_61 [Vibrio phage 1.188.A._10N.286.51.A6]AUR93715.1 hypothetical protein NVP1188B_61 [Vibrio phage 1.188.B._10N.286.51.A6]AUR93801.1 hypothetical protein NVP1188C_61 [Vibrio phage 1.188.C._10N.286.51.A6]
MHYTNKANLRLPIVAWLLADTYDFNPKEKQISATGLLKSVRQNVMGQHVIKENLEIRDVMDLYKARRGHAIHDSVEMTWNSPTLRKAGLDFFKIDDKKVVVNPPAPVKGKLNLFMEQRRTIKMFGWTVSGKFDMVCNGVLEDYKTTSTYSYNKPDKVFDFRFQASVYKRIFPDFITKDYFYICYMFNDWRKADAEKNPDYPQSDIVYERYDFLPDEELDDYIETRLMGIERGLETKDFADLPQCTSKELWQTGETVHKYFKDPKKTDGRATMATHTTSNKTLADLRAAKAKNGTGIIKAYPPLAIGCNYCPARFADCSQYLTLKKQNLIKEK